MSQTLATLFVPVIFGNGIDEDTNGMLAALKNERVMIGDTIYEPGQTVQMHNLSLVLNSKRLMFRNYQWISPEFDNSFMTHRLFIYDNVRLVPIVRI